MRTHMQRYAKYVTPLAVIVLVSCLMTLMFYPMMNANMKELPVAILSLDEGAKTAQGDMNVGDVMVDKLTESAKSSDSDGQAAIKWTKVSTQKELGEGFDNRDYYAAIVVPKDFTAKQMAAKQAAVKQNVESATALAQVMTQAQTQAAQQGLTGEAAQQFVQASLQKAAAEQAQSAGASEASSSAAAETGANVKLVIDNAKSPLIANLLKQSVPAMLERTGAAVKVTVLNEGDVTTNSSLPTAAMMGQNVLIMPVYMMSMLVSFLVVGAFARKNYDDRTQRWATFGGQLAAAAVWAFCVALGADCIFAMLGSGWLPGSMLGFLWFASFALMTLFLGLMNVNKFLGLGCGLLGLGLGMTSGLLPYELLPEFWQNWVYGWVPQHFIGDGVRAVLYRGGGWWNVGSGPLLIILCVGLVIFVCAGLLPLGRHRASEVSDK
ncbi:YhgE/Pip domain-containing protein [Bifidobacterium callimiconis]|uniref:ABC-2 type transporter transmembrane domain-containing protein n=1 Tax=Bifidobacterium callimiconis TaxID=2306973 RepID=A0A430FFJ2_9BIFI|nr:ABC-2 transporter permease [Bifidobacterium callimiconis]RSX51633.1 hypothetical protein D2E23_0896 [Bifidobacterium callimiconis]